MTRSSFGWQIWLCPIGRLFRPLTLTPISLVSNGLMALFLFYIGKELWEAMVLERGALAGRSRIAMPLGAVAGGMVGAVAVWLLWSSLFVTAEEAGFLTGWTVPLGSDVVLCYVTGRAVFGRDHPALHLLLLITIAFDILGLLLSGLVSPLAEIRPLWLVAARRGIDRGLVGLQPTCRRRLVRVAASPRL